jgi:hypothetical protein
MKKLIATTAIILGLSMTTFAQGGLFHRGAGAGDSQRADYSLMKGAGDNGEATPMLPNHDATGGNQPAPVGSGIAVLMGLGAAYMVAKKRREE